MDGPGQAPVEASDRYKQAIARLMALARTGMTLGLGPITRVLDALGHPQRAFPSVHIAGSNGKGSTAAFIASILSARKQKIGLYSSPHLVSLTERIQLVEGTRPRQISEDALLGALDAVERVTPGFSDLSFFEAITAAAFVALKGEGVDVGVIEAGLGARLDATMLVDAHVAVLTDLALEHTEILGDTIEAIAREKSAVARAGRPLVLADGPAQAMRVIEQAANDAHAPVFKIGRELQVASRDDGTFDLELPDRRLESVRLSLLGPHQGRNAVLAATAATLIDRSLSDETLRRGLAMASWPGRMEIVRPAAGPPILLDAAHNAHGAEALAKALIEPMVGIDGPFHFVFGVLADKDARRMLASIAPLARSLTFARPTSPRARAPSELPELLPAGARPELEVIEDDEAAFAAAVARASEDGGWVVVCGSLYLVGSVRARLFPRCGTDQAPSTA